MYLFNIPSHPAYEIEKKKEERKRQEEKESIQMQFKVCL